MSLVDATTGEVEHLPAMSEDEARSHVQKMHGSLNIAAEHVLEAWQRQAWKALGYRNWESFLDGEFPELGMNAAARHALAVGLRNAGMSLRSIASTTGQSRNTVRSQVGQIDPPAEVVGMDGKTYPVPERTEDRGGDAADGDEAGAESSGSVPRLAPESPPAGQGTATPEPSPEELRAQEVKTLAKAIVKSHELFMFDAEMVAELNEPDLDRGIRDLMERIAPWWETYKAAKPKGLRPIDGGRK